MKLMLAINLDGLEERALRFCPEPVEGSEAADPEVAEESGLGRRGEMLPKLRLPAA